MRRCSHCGSKSHDSFDCQVPGKTYVPTPEDLAADAAEEARLRPQQVASNPPKPAEPEQVFEEGPPRFRGCPPVCTATNLPAHESRDAALAFHARNGPSCSVLKVGQCKACGKWHYSTEAPAPGDSKRKHALCMMVFGRVDLPPGFVPFRRRLRESAFAAAEPELPKREVAAPAKGAGTSPVKALKSVPLGELFGRAKT